MIVAKNLEMHGGYSNFYKHGSSVINLVSD